MSHLYKMLLSNLSKQILDYSQNCSALKLLQRDFPEAVDCQPPTPPWFLFNFLEAKHFDSFKEKLADPTMVLLFSPPILRDNSGSRIQTKAIQVNMCSLQVDSLILPTAHSANTPQEIHSFQKTLGIGPFKSYLSNKVVTVPYAN